MTSNIKYLSMDLLEELSNYKQVKHGELNLRSKLKIFYKKIVEFQAGTKRDFFYT